MMFLPKMQSLKQIVKEGFSDLKLKDNLKVNIFTG